MANILLFWGIVMKSVFPLIILLFATHLGLAQYWTPLGPFNTPIDMGGAGTFVGIGMVTAIDFSRQDSNRVFLGAANGGVWVYDMQQDRTGPLYFDTVAPFIGVASLVVDPANDKVIYVATGDKIGPFGWGETATSSTGIYYTRNGGFNWQHSMFFDAENHHLSFAYSAFNYHRIPKIIINPANPRTLWCVEHGLAADNTNYADNGHIYVSHNAGETWQAVSNAAFTDVYFNDIVYDPADTNVIYATSHLIYCSKDGGSTWSDVTKYLKGYTPETNAIARICLSGTPAYAPAPCVAVLTLSQKNADLNRLYLINKPLDSAIAPVKSTNLNAADFNNKYKYGICLSGIAGTLYPYGTLFQASYNSGRTLTSYAYGQQMHPDIHYVAVSPHSSQSHLVFVGTDGGLYISRNMGKSFTPHFKGFAATLFYSVAVSDNGKRIIGGTQDNGTLRCDSPKWYRIAGGGDGNNVLFNPGCTDTFLYGDFQGDEVFITRNGGKDFDARSFNGVHTIPTPLCFEPGHPLSFYVGTNDVWKVEKGGRSIKRISNFRLLDSTRYDLSNRINYIATCARDSNTIYVAQTGQWKDAQGRISGIDKDMGWNDTGGYSLHQVYATFTGGKTWEDITPVIFGGIGDINSIAVSPKNKKKIWVTHDRWTDNKEHNVTVFASTNGGKTWSPYYEGLPPVPARKVICTKGDALYLATNNAIYRRTPKMEQWENICYNLPHTLLKDLCYNYATHTLYVATWGRGIWSMEIK